MTAAFGFFGKIPDRGDFVRHGLPPSFVAPLDAWWQRVLPGSRAILGEAWVEAWMEAPIWRFALAPGVCGPLAAAGVWMPSTDKAGRLFPLTLAVTGPRWADVARCQGFMDAAEAAGIAALEADLSPDALAARLAAAVLGGDAAAAPGAGQAAWWTAGSPRVAATRHDTAGLPGSAVFAAMLDERLDGA